MFDIESGLVLLWGFAARRGFSLWGVLITWGKPFVDEVISAFLGAGVRLLC